MRLLADECCHGDLVQMLLDAGLDVLAVGEALPSLDDASVLALAIGQERLTITDDKDFGALVVERGRPSLGVILLRTRNVDGRFQARRVLELLRLHPDRLVGHIAIVEDGRFRFRRLSSI